jgi:hypothetical protein
MKIGAYIAFFFGFGNLVLGIASLSSQYAEQATGKIGFGIGAIVLGFFLLSKANQKVEEQKEKDKWSKGEK